MSIEDDIERLRSQVDCHNGQVVHECWEADGAQSPPLDGEIERVLDEIERLQTENAGLRKSVSREAKALLNRRKYVRDLERKLAEAKDVARRESVKRDACTVGAAYWMSEAERLQTENDKLTDLLTTTTLALIQAGGG